MIGAVDVTGFTGTYFPGNVEKIDRASSGRVSNGSGEREIRPDQVTTENTKDNSKTQNSANKQVAGDKSGAGKETQLSEDERKEVRELKQIDQKVRAHEMAHLSASQGIAVSGANFEYRRGPDGVNYAVGGEVNIDTSKEKDPQATIAKAQKIVAAALAPADPSAQDRSVASKAREMEAQARMELARQQQLGTGKSEASDTQTSNAGIKAYRQNQTFAPDVNSNNPDFNTRMNNITTAAASMTSAVFKFKVDIVA